MRQRYRKLAWCIEHLMLIYLTVAVSVIVVYVVFLRT